MRPIPTRDGIEVEVDRVAEDASPGQACALCSLANGKLLGFGEFVEVTDVDRKPRRMQALHRWHPPLPAPPDIVLMVLRAVGA
jgi:hypothetical protein